MNQIYIDKYKMVGLNIAYYRKLKNLTQEALAEAMDIDQTHLSKIERAAVGISLDNLFKIADILEIDVHKLLIFKD